MFFLLCLKIDDTLDVRKFWENEAAGILPVKMKKNKIFLGKEFKLTVEFKNNPGKTTLN